MAPDRPLRLRGGACVSALRAEGIAVYATELTDEAQDYLSVDFNGPTAIVLGNEHAGCSPEMVALADGAVIVPMVGFVQSLNVSVAAAVLLAEVARQRKDVQPPWTEHKAALLESWVERETAEALNNELSNEVSCSIALDNHETRKGAQDGRLRWQTARGDA